MSDLTSEPRRVDSFRWRLLATSSSLALLGGIMSANAVGNADRPAVWIEFGGQLERIEGDLGPFQPPFAAVIENADTICNLHKNNCGESAGFTSPSAFQRSILYSTGAEAKISLTPEGSNWNFSVAVRYGRSGGSKHTHEQTNKSVYEKLHKVFPTLPSYFLPQTHKVSDISVENREGHTILDFQAGRDVGLGFFGRSGLSQVAIGVKYAQFASASHVSMKADPDLYYPGTRAKYTRHHHSYVANAHNKGSFVGIGPSISWSADASILGNHQDEELSVDWGLNAAVLFGRQRAHGTARITTTYLHMPLHQFSADRLMTYHQSPVRARSRSVITPNVGGFVGASLQFPNAKLCLGYRADFFFGAMDGGIDTGKSTTRGFFGPFASISVGLGD